MKKKKMIILIIQVVVIIVGTLGFVGIQNNKVKPATAFVYNNAFDKNSDVLSEDDISEVSIPVLAITDDMVTSKDEILGLRVDTKVNSGQYIYKSQLIEEDDVDIFEIMDLKELRKISLPISLTDGFAGNVKKGDRVDLVFTGEGTHKDEETGSEENFIYSKVFMQDVLVYSVNTGDGYKFVDQSHYSPGEMYSGDVEISTDQKSQDFEIITLAVSLEQAEEIEARTNSGEVRFLGRFEDSKSYNTFGYVLGDYQKIYSGYGYAETGHVLVEEDDFDIID